jgi:hypothetical protein
MICCAQALEFRPERLLLGSCYGEPDSILEFEKKRGWEPILA